MAVTTLGLWTARQRADWARLLKAYGNYPSVVTDWPNDEYDRIYVFRIKDLGERKDLTFSVGLQGLTNSLSDKCPAQ